MPPPPVLLPNAACHVTSWHTSYCVSFATLHSDRCKQRHFLEWEAVALPLPLPLCLPSSSARLARRPEPSAQLRRRRPQLHALVAGRQLPLHAAPALQADALQPVQGRDANHAERQDGGVGSDQ